MTIPEAQELLRNDPNFVFAKRFDYSIEKLLERYPEGAPSHVIAGSLIMTEEEVEAMYQLIVAKLQKEMGGANASE